MEAASGQDQQDRGQDSRDHPPGRRYPSYQEAHASITSPRGTSQTESSPFANGVVRNTVQASPLNQNAVFRSNGEIEFAHPDRHSFPRLSETPRGQVGGPVQSPSVTPSRARLSHVNRRSTTQAQGLPESPVSTINGIVGQYQRNNESLEKVRLSTASPNSSAERVDQYGNVYEPFDLSSVTPLRPSSDTGDRFSLQQPIVDGANFQDRQQVVLNGTEVVIQSEVQNTLAQRLGAEVIEEQTFPGDQDWQTTLIEDSDEDLEMRRPEQGPFMRVHIDEPDYSELPSFTSLSLHKGVTSYWDPLSDKSPAAIVGWKTTNCQCTSALELPDHNDLEKAEAEITVKNVPEADLKLSPKINAIASLHPTPIRTCRVPKRISQGTTRPKQAYPIPQSVSTDDLESASSYSTIMFNDEPSVGHSQSASSIMPGESSSARAMSLPAVVELPALRSGMLAVSVGFPHH